MILTTIERGRRNNGDADGWDVFTEELERDEHGIISHFPLNGQKVKTREAADEFVEGNLDTYILAPSNHSTMPWRVTCRHYGCGFAANQTTKDYGEHRLLDHHQQHHQGH